MGKPGPLLKILSAGSHWMYLHSTGLISDLPKQKWRKLEHLSITGEIRILLKYQ